MYLHYKCSIIVGCFYFHHSFMEFSLSSTLPWIFRWTWSFCNLQPCPRSKFQQLQMRAMWSRVIAALHENFKVDSQWPQTHENHHLTRALGMKGGPTAEWKDLHAHVSFLTHQDFQRPWTSYRLASPTAPLCQGWLAPTRQLTGSLW